LVDGGLAVAGAQVLHLLRRCKFHSAPAFFPLLQC
jgi:hypothetical protein